MWKCVFHRGRCIEIQWEGRCFFLNPDFHNPRTQLAIEQSPQAHILLTPGHQSDNDHRHTSHQLPVHSAIAIEDVEFTCPVEGVSSFVAIRIAGHTIIYDNGIADDSPSVEPLASYCPIKLYVTDITRHGIDHHISLLSHVGGAHTIVPFTDTPQELAIDFAREIMMNSLGVPKYFKAGQYFIASDC